MRELTEQEFIKQSNDMINIVNENHERYQKDQELLEQAGNRGVNAKMKKVLNRILGNPEPVIKKEIIHMSLDAKDRLILKNSEKEIVGEIAIFKNIHMKIAHTNKRPVFQFIQGNDIYLEKDLKNNNVLYAQMKVARKEVMEEITHIEESSKEMLDAAKYLFSLIDANDYETIDKYIMYSMERLINNNLEAAPLQQRQTYTEVYVAIQMLNKHKELLNQYNPAIGDGYKMQLLYIEREYRNIIEKLINAGLYEIPNYLEEEKIARS